MRCEICENINHDLEQCPDIHLVIDKLKIISTYLTSTEMNR